ncbi:MAG: NAD(P)-dependent oxidoreductase [Rhodospirillaceae bacterium]|nr:NAD(P)-dependent oxidoreductase [Rhodospirillaceae bacterium]
MSNFTVKTVAIIGFGEAGGILGAELVRRGLEVRTYDILLDDPAKRAAMLNKAASAGVAAAESHAGAAKGADLVLSTVTAASSVAAAEAVAPHLVPGQVFLDLNSVSPEAKRKSARAVEASGADYVEAAVMAAVPPKRLAVPMLLGGRRAAEIAAVLAPLGCDVTPVADRVGVASAIKMCRSVMIKGLEALTIECLMGARRYGAEEEVLASLHGTFPSMGWTGDLPNYLVSRVAEHGRRRAAEMREVAATLDDGGLTPRMAPATAGLHDWFVEALAACGAAYGTNGGFDWKRAVDALLAEPPSGDAAAAAASSPAPRRA